MLSELKVYHKKLGLFINANASDSSHPDHSWFKELSPDQQEKYIRDHETKLKKHPHRKDK